MKKILFLFCFLPILSFGQTITVEIDSVTLIRYSGGNKSKPKPKPIPKPRQRKKHEDVKYSKQAIDTLRVRYPQKKIHSSYDTIKQNNIPPFRGKTIMDKNGRFHPRIKKDTYRTYLADSVIDIIKILDCKEVDRGIVSIDTVYTIDEKGDTIQDIFVTRTVSSGTGSMCYAPGLGILLWSKDRIVTFYSVCFHCNNVAEGPSESYRPEFKRCINLEFLREEIEELGYPLK